MMVLYKHQQDALSATKQLNRVAYYHDMGLGKTFTGSEKMKDLNAMVNLIVCQKSKIQDWKEHFETYYPVSVYDLTKKKNFEEFFKTVQEEQSICVGIINYELAWRRKKLLELKDFTLMLDESSLIQNSKAKQTKFILKLEPANCIELSGTPVGGKFENLWTQCHLLGWDISESLFLKQYVNWTSIEAGGMVHKIVDKSNPYKNTDRLKSKLIEHGANFLKTEEVIDLPDQIFQKIQVAPTKQYQHFMKNDIISLNRNGEWFNLVGDTTLTKRLYARQLCGQYNQEKVEAVKDLIESTQDKMVVFYNFDAELELLQDICRQAERPSAQINGHKKELDVFEQTDSCILLVQYQSGAKGLNLQGECNRIIYFTLPQSSEDFEQSKKRIHRIGQNKTCFYYLMICRSSIEEDILETLEQRKDYTDELFKKKYC